MDYIKRHHVVLAAAVLALVLLAAIGATAFSAVRAAHITGQQTVVLAPEQLSPGAQAALRVIAQDFNTGKPLPDTAVTVQLVPRSGGKSLVVFEGRTDDSGSADVRFAVPEGLEEAQQLVVETESSLGSDRLEQAVTVRREAKLLLTTDKPLYQPGQTIHIRSLALSSADLAPAAGQAIELTIEDPKGNKVFRKELTASDWGIASVDFALADEVNLGTYKVVARVGETETEKTVTVKRYVLPKFRIAVETDHPYYLAGQRVVGHLRAEYFFGKPVAQAQVELRGSVYAIERQEVLTLTGTTDDEGRFDFQFDLPDYFVGGAPETETATFGLEITVIDQAQHAEMTAHTLPVAQEPLLIEAIPESGMLKFGLENIIYILTSTPDGAPAEAALLVEVAGRRTELAAGRYGLAEFVFVPADESSRTLTITARDAAGNQTSRTVVLEGAPGAEALLLRPERAAYRVGETMHLDAFTSAPSGAVFLDVVREGQTVSTRALDVRAGRATVDIDLDETLYGTLQLHAYKVLPDATIAGDTRLVIVERAADIDLTITPDRETYSPGDTARVTFETTRDGQPVPAALGISAVDESLFALQEQEAGFAKLYFLLQAELLEPKYQIKGFTPAGFTSLPEQPTELRQAQDGSAKAALAKVPGMARLALVQPRWEKEQAIRAERQAVLTGTTKAISWAVAALSLCGLIVSLVALGRRRVLGRSLGFGLLGLLVLAGVAVVIVVPLMRYGREEAALVVFGGLALLALAALIGLAIYAWRRKETALRVMLLLLLGCLLLVIIAGNAIARAEVGDWEAQLATAALALVLLLLAFYLRGVGFGVERQRLPAALGVILGATVLLPVLAAGAFGLASSRGLMFGAAAPMPQMVEKMVMATVVVENEVMVQAPMEAPRAAAGAPAAQEPPRLRQYFPETLYWNPQAITDEQGRATLDIPMADSITTWRLSALASSQRGELGNATAGLRVFQDFFIDLDLPLYLTQNDEVALPVAVYNYLPHAQTVRLVAEPAEWYELLDEAEKSLTIAENDVEVVYFRIRAASFGRQRFQVTAWGETMSDAIIKEVQVMPDGKQFRQTASDNLRGPVKQTVAIPTDAIPGTAIVYVKVYPGVVSQVVEGLQGMLRMPFG